MRQKRYLCLLCGRKIEERDIELHKKISHRNEKHYGIMWPLFREREVRRDLWKVPIYESPIFAKEIGVRKVYIRDEGQNFSGSMKDYIVERGVKLGLKEGFRIFSVVSSGNHAFSAAKYAKKYKVRAIVFTPASSSKISLLACIRNALVVGVKNTIFEEVYLFANQIELEGVYNLNVSNEKLLVGFQPIAKEMINLDPFPTHVLSGVGNGSYLAGIALGLEKLEAPLPKIVPVGMKGAFPTETAFAKRELLFEYKEFLIDEKLIDTAEGSIATASYSMPQLMNAVYLTNGFPLGGLTNEDLRNAYLLLVKDKFLIEKGAIPEPTGIMGLAAALKYRERFKSSDVLLVSFTGHAVKDLDGIRRLVPEISDLLISKAKDSRGDLIVTENSASSGNVIIVEKNLSPEILKKRILNWIEERRDER